MSLNYDVGDFILIRLHSPSLNSKDQVFLYIYTVPIIGKHWNGFKMLAK